MLLWTTAIQAVVGVAAVTFWFMTRFTTDAGHAYTPSDDDKSSPHEEFEEQAEMTPVE